MQDTVEPMQAAQDNLNSNPTNIQLAERLVQVTKETSESLMENFSADTWINPFVKK